jgi:hypothetical protein
MEFLHEYTIEKIFREHFKGENPIVKSGAEQKEFLSNIKHQLNTKSGFNVLEKPERKRYQEPADICCFQIPSSSKYYSKAEFYLSFNDKNEFIIEGDYWITSNVYSTEQFDTLPEKMKREYKRLEANYLKRQIQSLKKKNQNLKKQKIKELKHKAIVAKINEIAKEDKFKFSLVKYKTKIKLVIRLTKSECMEIDIPYEDFQEKLKNLRATIQTVRDLYDTGNTFQIQSYSQERANWISFD